MTFRLKPGQVELSIRRLRSGKLNFYDPELIVEDKPAQIGAESEYIGVTEASVQLKGLVQSGRTFICPPIVSLGRNMALVHLNPRISEALGYVPGHVTMIEAGFYEQLELSTMGMLTEEQVDAIHEAADDYVFGIQYMVMD